MKKVEKEEVKKLQGKLKRGDIECYESTIIEVVI
jgi:hypothetical protein